MPDLRMAGEDPGIRRYMGSRQLASPAFQYGAQGFELTPDARRVVSHVEQRAGRRYTPLPANSVMADNGQPIWGAGGGFAEPGSGVSYVDPFEGTTAVVAHEAGHAVVPTKLILDSARREWINPRTAPRDTGARMRLVHEQYAKPVVLEEAAAQGVAAGTLDALGLPGIRVQQAVDDGKSRIQRNPLEYPGSYMNEGIGLYGRTEVGPPSMGEKQEAGRIFRGIDAAMDRAYRDGYWRMR